MNVVLGNMIEKHLKELQFYFMHYSYVAIILFNTSLYTRAFFTYSFWKLIVFFCLSFLRFFEFGV